MVAFRIWASLWTNEEIQSSLQQRSSHDYSQWQKDQISLSQCVHG